MIETGTIIALILTCGIPGTLSSIMIKKMGDNLTKKEADRKQHDLLMIDGIKSSIKLGEATALAVKCQKDKPHDQETEEALIAAKASLEAMDKFIYAQAMERLK